MFTVHIDLLEDSEKFLSSNYVQKFKNNSSKVLITKLRLKNSSKQKNTNNMYKSLSMYFKCHEENSSDPHKEI